MLYLVLFEEHASNVSSDNIRFNLFRVPTQKRPLSLRRREAAAIPQVRPGRETEEYLREAGGSVVEDRDGSSVGETESGGSKPPLGILHAPWLE